MRDFGVRVDARAIAGYTIIRLSALLLSSIWARATIRNRSTRRDDIKVVIPQVAGFLSGCVTTYIFAYADDVIN